MSGKLTRDMIPNRLPEATYTVTIGAAYLQTWLADAEKDYGIDLQPSFQRPLVWDDARKVAYVEFLLRGGKGDSRNITFNSPAFGRDNPSAACTLDNKLLLVDGQQRLNAILSFLNNEIQVFGQYRLSDFDDATKRDVFGPGGALSINLFVNALETFEEVLTYYLELNEGGMAHTAEELDRVRAMRDQARAA